jgi:hypothetical protein
MAVTATPLGTRIQLRLTTGFTLDGKPIISTRSYANLKAAASHDNLYETGLDLAGLQEHELEVIRRIDEMELFEEE